MLTASFVTIALVVALVVGGALTAWLWTAYCKRLVAAGGLRALAAMRWREFSRFVIEALQAQGFEASRIEPDAQRGQQADLLLNRDDQTWLLSCKQGVNYRITAGMVDEIARAVRGSNAKGGILATLGRVEPEARKHNQGIELLDGSTLWPLIDPLLPPSLHRDLVAQARAHTLRITVLAWIGALVLGVAVAMLVPATVGQTPDPAPTATPVVTPAPIAATVAEPAPETALDEDGQRLRIERDTSILPGIEHASWATRSTLLVQLLPDATEGQIDAICTVLERSEALRASRVQLQPAAGSDKPVRFMQCRTF
ncbi:restriction endonuclease [Novilysobacter erysipheiresistens]|uniref:Restriction endonuclease n=1 Tax=Novilysobacter erysipheiresistens TaxID=1749332 RepID=A0ABU7Z0V2_9GAMM